MQETWGVTISTTHAKKTRKMPQSCFYSSDGNRFLMAGIDLLLITNPNRINTGNLTETVQSIQKLSKFKF